MDGSERRERLRAARLYLVTGARPGGRPLADVVRPALLGGVDIVQVREKDAPDEEVLAAAAIARELCDEAGALLFVNDRPDLAVRAGADGVHVGQDDMPVAQARDIVGPDLLIGLSTHAPEEIEAADADAIGVGPVHATPTKPGRLAVGLDLVRHAAAHAELPWFAIGGVDPLSVRAVVEAGATRIAVVRAITEADDPEAAARALRAALPAEVGESFAFAGEPVADRQSRGGMATRSRRKNRPAPRTPPPVLDPDATFTERYRARTEWRNEEIRSGLEPLAPGERPTVVTVGAVVALVTAVLNVAAALSGRSIAGDAGDQTVLTIITTAILVVVGTGMLLRQYWAVLGFEIVLGLQIVAMSLALVFVADVGVAALLLVLVVALGALFWKLVRAMARMQMPAARPEGDPAQPVQ